MSEAAGGGSASTPARRSPAGFALAVAIGAAGGALFAWAQLPLAWMLGAMTATGAAAILGLPVAGSQRVRAPMAGVIGAMLGAQLGLEALASAARWWPAMLGLAAYLAIAAALSYQYLRRVVKLDPVTGYFSAMPGGLVDMVLMGAERGGDERTIALMHSSRIFLVVFSLPAILLLMTGAEAVSQGPAYRPLGELGLEGAAWFVAAVAAGMGLGRLLRLPAPFLIGPMLASVALHWSGLTEFTVPTVLMAAAQVVLGATVGCRFAGTAPRRILRILLVSAGATAILLATALPFALLLPRVVDVPAEGILLAFSPGGLAEMSLVALALNIEVSFVVLCHMSRILMVILGAGIVAKLRNV